MPGIKAVGLGTLFATLQGLGLRGLCQVWLYSRSAKFFDHVAPAGGGLYSDSDLLTTELLGELAEPLPQALASGRADLATMYLSGLHLDVVEGDLLPMYVETA